MVYDFITKYADVFFFFFFCFFCFLLFFVCLFVCFFNEKMRSFCTAKASHMFSTKYWRIIDINV